MASVKRDFSALSLKEALQMVPTKRIAVWQPDAPPAAPSAYLTETLTRLRAFDLQRSEAAKILLIDALLIEVAPSYPQLKVWKASPLESDVAMGVADYLIAPDYAYVETPLLCAVEAKRDDFDGGRIQCIAEMAACRWNNAQAGRDVDVYGIVSNGQGWVFYRLTTVITLAATDLYALSDLPDLLGVLHHTLAACAANVP